MDTDDSRRDKTDQSAHTQSHWPYLKAVDEFGAFHELRQH